MSLIETATTDDQSPGKKVPFPSGQATDRAERIAQPKQISLHRALASAPFRPAWVAERTTHLPLKRAWVGHLISAVGVFIVVGLLTLWAQWPTLGPTPISQIVREGQRELGLLLSELARSPFDSVFAVLGIIALIEVGHLAIALNLMPWGARDEPLRKSFGFAVRQTWLSSARLILAALIIGGPLAAIEYENRLWDAAYAGPRPPEDLVLPVQPAVSMRDPGYDKAMTNYEAAVDAYYREYEPFWEAQHQWRAERPWLLKIPYVVGIPLGFFTSLWFLWALVRAVGATRNVPPIARVRRCIECGYDLRTIAMESRCPECGKPIAESLGPNVHPGTPWQHHPPGGALKTWWRCAVDVVRTPGAFGKSLRVNDTATAHRRFFAIALVAVSLVAEAALLLTAGLLFFPQEVLRDPELLVIVPIAVGSLCVAGTLLVACAGATLVGLSQSLTYGRNLLPTAMQVASYLGGFLLLWAILGATLILGLVWMGESNRIESIAKVIGTPPDVFVSLYFCIPNFACAALFMHRLAIATAATRYANK